MNMTCLSCFIYLNNLWYFLIIFNFYFRVPDFPWWVSWRHVWWTYGGRASRWRLVWTTFFTYENYERWAKSSKALSSRKWLQFLGIGINDCQSTNLPWTFTTFKFLAHRYPEYCVFYKILVLFLTESILV